MKNGRGEDHDDDPKNDPQNDPKISRIEDARRRRARGEAAAPGQRGAAQSPARIGGTMKDWLIGAVLVAMALGFVASLLEPVWRSVAK